jgi:hypothetical protein
MLVEIRAVYETSTSSECQSCLPTKLEPAPVTVSVTGHLWLGSDKYHSSESYGNYE